MKYRDGQDVMIGDQVRLEDGRWNGVVVCLLDERKFTPDHPEREWGHLTTGVLVKFEEVGLVYYEDEIEPDIELAARE